MIWWNLLSYFSLENKSESDYWNHLGSDETWNTDRQSWHSICITVYLVVRLFNYYLFLSSPKFQINRAGFGQETPQKWRLKSYLVALSTTLLSQLFQTVYSWNLESFFFFLCTKRTQQKLNIKSFLSIH